MVTFIQLFPQLSKSVFLGLISTRGGDPDTGMAYELSQFDLNRLMPDKQPLSGHPGSSHLAEGIPCAYQAFPSQQQESDKILV